MFVLTYIESDQMAIRHQRSNRLDCNVVRSVQLASCTLIKLCCESFICQISNVCILYECVLLFYPEQSSSAAFSVKINNASVNGKCRYSILDYSILEFRASFCHQSVIVYSATSVKLNNNCFEAHRQKQPLFLIIIHVFVDVDLIYT